MNRDKEMNNNKLNECKTGQVTGGAIFEVGCSCCGKKINYADHRWGNETINGASFCKGYLCNECVEKFRSGKINDEKQLSMFNQLDNRGDDNRYKPYV